MFIEGFTANSLYKGEKERLKDSNDDRILCVCVLICFYMFKKT